jgi:hypothetical protein
MLEQTDRRRYVRYPIRVPITVRAEAVAPEIRSEVADLSQGGLSFTSPRPLPEGSTFEVVLPVEDEAFILTGSVARCVPEEADRFRIGVAFVDPQASFSMKLAEQMLRIQELRRELENARGRAVPVEEAARLWVSQYAEEFAEMQ